MRKGLPLQDRSVRSGGNAFIMVSACLLGVRCRYDGDDAFIWDLVKVLASECIIPFCPEQMGGLPTPRAPARMYGGDGLDVLAGKARMVNDSGEDVTAPFTKGAHEALRLARLTGSQVAVVKEKSPSCGLSTPYCDIPTGPAVGVTAALFKKHGFHVFEAGSNRKFPVDDFFDVLHRGYG